MYLKQVEIQGFKSFPDKINIEFDQGVTAIVGPNGSGKSNISDAVLWVLGEQRAKTLRGEKMEDVIFSGTQSRNPVGFAQVTLVIDNRQRLLAFPADEVNIMRRVYRSGESEYKINQKACRLKDITELFLDTGVGRDGYSMVGQGKIDSILSSKPEERRQIFEEAAGVSKYRYKKEEAQRKLKTTRENLIRIHDIVLELETQIGPLSRQRKKALEYLEHKEHLKAMEVSVALDTIETLKAGQEAGQKDLAEAREALGKAQNALDEGQKTQQAVYDRMRQDDEKAEAVRGEVLELTRSLGDYRQDIALFEREIEHLKQEEMRLAGEIDSGKAVRAEGEKQQAEWAAKYDALHALRQEAQEKLEQMEGKARAAFEQGREEQEADRMEQQISDKQRQLFDQQSKEASFAARLESISRRLAELREEYEQLGREQEGYAVQEEALLAQLEKNGGKLCSAQQALEEKQEEFAAVLNSLETAKERRTELHAKYEAVKSRLSMLKNSQADLEGLSFGAKKVLEAQKRGQWKSGALLGALPMLLETDETYSAAIEVALGAHNQSIVTGTQTDAKNAISYLKEKKFGRVTFLPLDSIKTGTADFSAYLSMPGAVAAASDLVRYDTAVQPAVLYALGKTLVVDTLDHAFAIEKKAGQRLRVVTLGGELLSPGGSVSGGSSQKSAGILSRRAQEQLLQRQETELAQELKTAAQACSRLQENQAALEASLASSRGDAEQIHARGQSIQTELDHATLLRQRAEDTKNTLLEKVEQIEREQTQIQEQEQAERLAADALSQEIETMREEYSALLQRSSEILQKREEYNRAILSQRLSAESIEKDMQHAYDQKRSLESGLEDKAKEIFQKEGRLVENQQQAEEIQADIAFKRQQMQEIEEECAEKEAQVQALLKNRADASQEIQAAQETVQTLTKELLQAQKKAGDLENSQQRIDAQLEDVYNHLWEEYELTYSSALALKEELGEQEGSQLKISKIKSLIKNLGNINLDSIEQYKEVKERYDFLTGQEKDLEEAAAELSEMAETMTKTMEKLFRDNFRKISERFSSVFQELFGGGRGELKLTDPDHVLESPIEIIVQPKGKRLQSISLLSGGEKALGAIAILFSILYVKPTPFCIFDEIEAALDDTNVDRFASYIHKFTDFTQFIVITHRRGTMETADTLFGVTMQEKGVSQLLPLKLSDLAKRA